LVLCYHGVMNGPIQTELRGTMSVGEMLKEWRQRRHLSQQDLAFDADVSARHLSFLETGRAQPSRDMLFNLAEHLSIPLRERNALLVAAGFAPAYSDELLGDPGMEAARKAIDFILSGHEPFPALAIDRYWNLVASNKALGLLLEGVDPSLLAPPVNVLRLSLHPLGLAPRIVNFKQWRAHACGGVRKQIDVSGDPILRSLLDEISSYPVPDVQHPVIAADEHNYAGLAVPFRLATSSGMLSFVTTTTVFGTPVSVTLSELAIESFYPADAATAIRLRSSALAAEL